MAVQRPCGGKKHVLFEGPMNAWAAGRPRANYVKQESWAGPDHPDLLGQGNDFGLDLKRNGTPTTV